MKPPGRIDAQYRAWIVRHECVAPSKIAGGEPCQGVVVCHHSTGKGMGGSKQDDRDGVPLCTGHHAEIHGTGRLRPYTPGDVKSFFLYHAHGLLKLYIDEEVLSVLDVT